MKKFTRLLSIYLSIALVCSAFPADAQVPFTPGNIVVCRIGNGTATLVTSSSRAVFLDEFTPSGTLVQSIALPTTASGSNRALTMSTTIATIGMLTRSIDGRFLVLAGFDAAPNTSLIESSNSSTINRTIGLVKYDGTINTSTALTDYSSQGAPTAAATTDGTNIWLTGQGTGLNTLNIPTGGIRYTTVGSTTSTAITDPEVGHLALDIAAGQLYRASTATPNMGSVGTGLPTTSGQTVTNLHGFPATGSFPLNQFVFLDINPSVPGVDVLYIADGSSDIGGLKKYSLVGGNWTLNGIVGGSSDRFYGLTATVSGSTVTLYFTKMGSFNTFKPGDLAKLTDAAGYNGAFSGTPTVIATITSIPGVTTSNTAGFFGVALVPVAPGANISTKIFLQGAYNTGLGRHKDVTSGWAAILNANALNQPFNTAAFGNYNGGESVSAGFFTSTGATTDILDWVLVELRNSSTPSTVVAREAAFVREDGQIVGLDGTSPVSFTGVANGNYYLVVRHRNHLAVRSATTISVSGGSTASYDFTTAQSKAFQDGTITANPAMKDLGSGVFGLWGGNANSNTNVRFTGLSNDAAAILAALSANQAATVSNTYNAADINMDGTVRYTGLNNDAAALLSVLGSNQAAVFTQHQ